MNDDRGNPSSPSIEDRAKRAEHGEQPPAPPAPSCVMVIFGASGDLTRRKLVPALLNLRVGGLLPDEFVVLGVARQPLSDDEFRQRVSEDLAACDESKDPHCRDWILQRMFYLGGDVEQPEIYGQIRARVDELGKQFNTSKNVLYYLAVAPTLFAPVVTQLGASGLSAEEDGYWRRVVIEKPFGQDLASAQSLNREVGQVLKETQTYRIDHYLGKETVQNILAFRFGNGVFEPIWNRRYIDHVQITAAETVGVERRANYYEGAGALRDMVQNHLMQLLALVAMEPPITFSAESVRDRKLDALLSAQPLVDDTENCNVVRAQYAKGWVAGAEVPGYHQEPGVNPESTTETYVALRMRLDSWRWAGVPFYLRTGKRLPKRTTEIAIQMRRPPLEIFKRVSPTSVAPNLLIVNVQPDEGISIRFEAKIPGTRMQLAPVMMNFRYGSAFGGSVPEAYETLLLDAMLGDPTLFARHDFVESSWALITPVHERWAAEKARSIPTYEAGEWGPPEADALMARDRHRWRTL